MLDTAYMSSSQVDIAQKYNDWNPDAIQSEVDALKCCVWAGDYDYDVNQQMMWQNTDWWSARVITYTHNY